MRQSLTKIALFLGLHNLIKRVELEQNYLKIKDENKLNDSWEKLMI